MKDFAKIFENFPEDSKAAILTHPGPDPDAISSCLGMQSMLLRKWGIKADIFMEGDYSSRRQNT